MVSYRIPVFGLLGPQVGNTRRIAAKVETTGCGLVTRRASGLPRPGRLRSAACCREARKCVPAIRSRQWSVQRPSASIILSSLSVSERESVVAHRVLLETLGSRESFEREVRICVLRHHLCPAVARVADARRGTSPGKASQQRIAAYWPSIPPPAARSRSARCSVAATAEWYA